MKQGILDLAEHAVTLDNFLSIGDYAEFGMRYLDFIVDGLQAEIVARNENNYSFFQYGREAGYAVTRPINTDILIDAAGFDESWQLFVDTLRDPQAYTCDDVARDNINRFVYTCQQSIGAALDALGGHASNRARKVNGTLFERFIREIINEIGIEATEGTVSVPIIVDDEVLCSMSYQHDVILPAADGSVLAIGSVKTSSKDRVDKIFIDKYLYNSLMDYDTPHFAVFLNDVQRAGREPRYQVNSTFLTGHFKGYTVKLNPLDGVYYCDLRPVMTSDPFLRQHIQHLDALLVDDIWEFMR